MEHTVDVEELAVGLVTVEDSEGPTAEVDEEIVSTRELCTVDATDAVIKLGSVPELPDAGAGIVVKGAEDEIEFGGLGPPDV